MLRSNQFFALALRTEGMVVDTGRISAVATAVPPFEVTSEEAKRMARSLFASSHRDIDRLLTIFDHSQVNRRHFCVPLEWFATAKSFAEKNDMYLREATALATKAALAALESARVTPEEIDAVVFVTSTGIATPSLDVRMARQLGLRPNIRRIPLWGLGCAGGAAGLARAHDYTCAHPGHIALLVAVELCGLTFVHGDRSKSNLVGSALFADGAAALVVGGDETELAARSCGPDIIGSHSQLWPDSEDIMGWDVGNNGLSVRFSRDIPTLVRREICAQVDAALAAYGANRQQLLSFIAHPGGAKVLSAYEEALELPASALDDARSVLADFGNMSSPTVLFVLERSLAGQARSDRKAGIGILAALGPGFSCEQVVLAYPDELPATPLGAL